MGVFKPGSFSFDSRDHFWNDSRDCNQEIEKVPLVRTGSTPDPTKFEILSQITVNGYPILEVNYPGVKNYEGNKILMYHKNFNLDLIKTKIDPHFFTEGDSPIARFEPTNYGFELALTLANNLP